MKTLQSEKGFTLIEVLIAIIVLSVGVLATYSMQITGITLNGKASGISVGANYAGDRIEQIFAMDYTLLTDSNGDGAAGLENDTMATADDFRINKNTADTTKEDPSLPEGCVVYWNVVEDFPLLLTKTLNVIVTTKQGVRVANRYIKAEVVTN